MTKKVYMQPAIELEELDLEELLLVYSVKSTGLGDADSDNLEQGETSGDTWSEAMSRGAWEE